MNPCKCYECDHQMAWHRAVDQCGEQVVAACDVPGCFCRVKVTCEHVSGRNEAVAVEEEATILSALGIAAE